MATFCPYCNAEIETQIYKEWMSVCDYKEFFEFECLDFEKLTDWEENFVISVDRYFDGNHDLTKRQEEIVRSVKG